MATTLSTRGLFLDNQALGGDMLLTDVAPYYEYVEQKRTGNIQGYRYTVVLPHRGFEQLDVKIPGKQQLEITYGDSFPVTFKALQVRPYVNRGTGKLAFTAQAEAICKVGEKH